MSGKRRIALRGLEFLCLINRRFTDKFSGKSEKFRLILEITLRKIKYREKTVALNKLEFQCLNITQ